MTKYIRGSGIRKKTQLPKSSFRDSLGFYRDILDAILKSAVVFLPLPAIQVYAYLRLIGHTDLFASAVLSVSGLSTLFQASVIAWAAFLVCIVGPSVILGLTFSSARPSKGTARFVLLGAVLWAAFYGMVFGFYGDVHPSVGYWCVVIFLMVGIVSMLCLLAWKSPPWMSVVPREPTNTWINQPGEVPDWIAHHVGALRAWRILHRPRFWLCMRIMASLTFAGVYCVISITTVYDFKDAYSIPDKGWGAAGTMGGVALFSFLPGAVYLGQRAFGHSNGLALKRTVIFIGMVLIVSALNGFLTQAPAFAIMRAIGISDTFPRTYEILKSEELPIYRKLGYAERFPKVTDRFVEAVTGFQLADVKLVCPRPFKFPSGWALPQGKGSIHIDTTGCLRSIKDEIRVVDWPTGKPLLVDPPAQASSTSNPNVQKPDAGPRAALGGSD
jgi:hypothetical protein